jgi:hypothetical protein
MIDLRNALDSDLDLLVSLHQDSYPRYLFTSRFSRRMLVNFYEKQMKHGDCTFVISTHGHAVGIIMGSEKAGTARSEFIRENILSVFMVIIKNPVFLLKKLKSLLSKKESFESRHKFRFLNLLISKNELRGLSKDKGMDIPRDLTMTAVSMFEQRIAGRGIDSYGHSVDRSNLVTINFHLKNGCRIERIVGDSVFMFKTLKDNRT